MQRSSQQNTDTLPASIEASPRQILERPEII